LQVSGETGIGSMARRKLLVTASVFSVSHALGSSKERLSFACRGVID
jgi:hypothetical protein